MTAFRFGSGLLALTMLIAVGGCATIRHNEAKNEGARLVAAGFSVEPATDPERARELHTMPPLEMVLRPTGAQGSYQMADPYVCQCVYAGDRQAWVEYQRILWNDYYKALDGVFFWP